MSPAAFFLDFLAELARNAHQLANGRSESRDLRFARGKLNCYEFAKGDER